ncbi:hypothetical protein DRM94_00405 [Aeromonas taiwanensis]|uniref:Uncharacterized protein n=1 Tax=Aeromonas taiwanensis TaxID=633417 RepID=A0A5F0KGE3_9GAMM|nr:hypothetical protein [Aeromonas taiwanensis]TFF81271.1 hypothetical protein DRM93_00405 [Aeromonas taiwanensis]TFF82215.1 hypothetical protein DRM95_00405 [Aeromonas taiwanensis]TFF83526.1 hypothetical protein DRM94_00405 [Aeromonas taiwanensis]
MFVSKQWATMLGALLTLGLLGTTPAQAAAPDGVQLTLEGCRKDAGFTFPDGGPYICPDSNYTTGNLGKTWNELDLVPYRITLKAGNSAPANQEYKVAVALDNQDAGRPGYDILSAPVLNAAKSSPSCSAVQSTAQASLTPGIGGTDTTIYRILTVTQVKNSTCVYDYYGRLALGAHLYPGASLHANLLAENLGTGGAGARDVSIPVKEIEPQEISKTMAAQQGASQTWNISKGTEDTLDFGNVCRSDAPESLPVEITVTWTKAIVTGGNVAVNIVLYAKNPAARTITVDLTDKLYKGSDNTGTLLGTYHEGPFDLAAGFNDKVAEFTVEFAPADAGNVGDWLHNEVAGTYTDLVTGIPVPGTTKSVADAQIQQGTVLNAIATIQDVEDIDGDGLKYAVGVPSLGGFLNGYVAGTKTDGEVGWEVAGQTTSGSITFVKQVYLDQPKRVTSGVLRDTAHLMALGGFTADTNELQIPITSSVQGILTIQKSIPSFLDTGEKLEVTFRITRANDPSFDKTEVITFLGGGTTTQSTTLSGLVPDLYSVEEKGSMFFADGSSTGEVIGLADPRDPAQYPNPRPVDLRLEDGIATHCAATADFQNEPTTEPAKVQVEKVTEPLLDSSDNDYDWTFKLYGPGGTLLSTKVVGAGTGFGKFLDGVDDLLLTAEGAYTVVETTKSGWDLISVNPDSPVQDKVCDFVVDYPEDAGKTFSCSFLNRERGRAQVLKTLSGSTDLGGYAFTFVLRQGASTVATGQTLESMVADAGNGGTLMFTTELIPGQTYQICEIVGPGWLSSFGTFVPGAFTPPDGQAPNPNVDNSIICGDFEVGPGETKVFEIDNTPPPGGRALTIGFWKNWASCAKSNGKQKDVLDQTLASFAGGGVYIGKLFVDTCQEAVRILSKQDVGTGKQKSSDPAFNMAAQLLAAKLNVQAGAGLCPNAATAIIAGQEILDGPPPSYAVNFTGTGDYPKKGQFASEANSLATTLDQYNNNYLCVGP